jgi:hypothetical protein
VLTETIFLAGYRQMADRSDWRARLPGGAERHSADRLPGDPGQPVDILYGPANPRIRHQR